MAKRKYKGWIFQASFFYDVNKYLSDYEEIYWSTPKLWKFIQLRDPVFIWRSKNASEGREYGAIAFGKVIELPKHENQIKKPENVANNLWNAETEKTVKTTSYKTGIKIESVKLNKKQGMLLADNLKEIDIIKKALILRSPTGTVFGLTGKELSIMENLWKEKTGGQSRDWTKEEVTIIIEDYFSMLSKELKGATYRKTEHRKKIIGKLNNRNKGSIEFKHQNISAILVESGCPYIEGYKPTSNYQRLLKESVAEYLGKTNKIFETVEPDPSPIPIVPSKKILDCQTTPPKNNKNLLKNSKPFKKPWQSNKSSIKVDYADRDDKNKKLGDAGEKFVLRFEKERLIKAGKKGLANKVEQISKTRGDGIGYDIESFSADGSIRWIEVKTTNQGESFPFYLSANELECSKDQPEKYYLYRVYSLNKSPKLYILQGDLSEKCQLQTKNYRAIPK